MSEWINWGDTLAKLLNRANLSYDDLLEDISLYPQKLSEKELSALDSINAESQLPPGIDRGTISRYVTNKRNPPDRPRNLLFIHYFSKKGVINLDEANEWLRLADKRTLNVDEGTVLFGYSTSAGLPRSYIPPQHSEPFLKFHDELIDKLNKELSAADSDFRTFVLRGPHGMGKSKIAHKVATELEKAKEQGVVVIFHSVDHVTEQEDASDALNTFIERLSSCFGIPATESIKIQRQRIKDSIEKHNYKLVLILDGLRNEIEEVFINFLESLPKSVKILMTHLGQIICRHSAQEYESISMPGIEDNRIHDFLKTCGLKTDLSSVEIEKIYQTTAGNSFALREIARALKENPNQKLDNILKVITNPNGNIAWQWVGRTYKDLSTEEQSLLKALSLFRESADRHILIQIARLDLDLEKPKPEIERIFDSLCNLDAFSPDEKSGRFRMEEPYRTYVRGMIEGDSEEKKKWKERWVEAYASLRSRDENFHDETGWTIFTDYIPDKIVQINYADEIETIIDVIQYCISKNRADDYWIIGADLLDDFRATFFATGRWNQRIKLCKRVLKKARQGERDYVVGKVSRLLAWIYCFQDNYEDSKKHAKRARKIAYKGFQNKHFPIKEHIIHRQTYYKSLNTSGQIALRQGQDAAIRGQIAIRRQNAIKDSEPQYAKHLEERAQFHLQEARKQFKKARDCFLRADGFVGAEFPRETLVTNFHIAEADYYNRHIYSLGGEKKNLQQSLEESLNAFQKILAKATDREHERLKAHTSYYLGKVYRRLTRHADEESKAGYFDKAYDHLEEALTLSRRFNDFVLVAKIEFALSQWYEEKYSFAVNETERNEHIESAKRLGQQAAEALAKLGMKMESADAVAFLQRLGKTDIPPELLEDFNARYGDI